MHPTLFEFSLGPSRVPLGQLGDRDTRDALERCVLPVDDVCELVRERCGGQPTLRHHGSIEGGLLWARQRGRVLGARRNRVGSRSGGSAELLSLTS